MLPSRLGNQISDVFKNKCMKQDSANINISSSLHLCNAVSQIGINSSLRFCFMNFISLIDAWQIAQLIL